MKKIISFIVIILIWILIILINKKDDVMEKKEKDLYQEYVFYKEEKRTEYINYQKKTSLPIRQAIINVNIGLNRPFYTLTKKANNPNSLTVLVNKYNYLEENFVPDNLVDTTEYAKATLKLKEDAYKAFIDMAKAIEKENMHIRIVSAYRGYDYQKNLYNNYLKYEPIEKVDTYSARAGYSEHQTGLAIDIDNTKINYNKFHLTNEFSWMKKNAYKYGFILRYPLSKEKITGYKYEPWHYRYIGKEIAEYIYLNDLTYDEYYYEFIDPKSK